LEKNEPTKKFYFGQAWQVYGVNSVDVPAQFTVEQAKKYVEKIWDNVGLASSAEYVKGSDEPDFEHCGFENEEDIQ